MIELQVDFDKRKHADIMRKCSLLADGKTIEKAIARAAKRAADAGKTETKRQLAAEYTLPPTEIGKTIFTGGSVTGSWMRLRSSPIALTKFKSVTPKGVMPPAKGPVKAQVKKSGGAELKMAFVAKMKSGHIGVFERKGEKRLPIKELFGPSTTGMFKANENVNVAVLEKIQETLDKRIEHELGRILNG